MAVAVLVVVVAGAAAAYFAFSGGDNPATRAEADTGPVGTVSRFLTGAQRRDYDSAAAEVCQQAGITATQLGAVFDQQFSGGIQSFEVEPAAASSSSTTQVKYTLTAGGQTSTYQASLIQSDGRYCITENRHLT